MTAKNEPTKALASPNAAECGNAGRNLSTVRMTKTPAT